MKRGIIDQLASGGRLLVVWIAGVIAVPTVPAAMVDWATYVGGERASSETKVASDHSGNVYVAGPRGIPSSSEDTYRSNTYLAKYSKTGQLLWQTHCGGQDDTYGPKALAVDNDGNVIMAMLSGGEDRIDGAVLLKISPAGNTIWRKVLSRTSECHAVGVDGDNNIYAAGQASNESWISGGFDTTSNGGGDCFLAKYRPDGTHLWSTYIGGGNSDFATSIAVKGSGKVYVAGQTHSAGWVSGGYDTTYNGGRGDGFVAKVSAAGSHTWSTYVGGNSYDIVNGITVDGDGNVFVAGATESDNGWISGGFDTTYNNGGSVAEGVEDGGDAFVAKISGIGERAWSTYLGARGGDYATAIVAAPGGSVLVTGATTSKGWVRHAFDSTLEGPYVINTDAFIAEVSGSGEHRWSSYFGGDYSETGLAIALGDSHSVFICGQAGDSIPTGTQSLGYLASIFFGNAANPKAWASYR